MRATWCANNSCWRRAKKATELMPSAVQALARRNPLNPQSGGRNIYGGIRLAVSDPRIAADGQPSLGRHPRPDLSRRFRFGEPTGTAIDDHERQWRGRGGGG